MDFISTPVPEDKRNRFRFKRDMKKHQEIIDKYWHDSLGTCNYLGEWHTHAEDVPEPSSIDKCGWIKKLNQDKFAGDYLFFVIVGIKKTKVWAGKRKSNIIFKLEEIHV